MLVLRLLDAKEHRNLQINCICRLLTALSIFSTLSSTLICQQFASRVASLSDAARFLYTRPPWFLSLHVLHSYRLRQLGHVHDFLLKAIQETEALFAFCVGGGNCFHLKESWLALQVESQAESKAEVLLLVKGLQKQACFLARIFHQEESEGWPSTMLVWKSSANSKTPFCQR